MLDALRLGRTMTLVFGDGVDDMNFRHTGKHLHAVAHTRVWSVIDSRVLLMK